jgi:hypothetical protein
MYSPGGIDDAHVHEELLVTYRSNESSKNLQKVRRD